MLITVGQLELKLHTELQIQILNANAGLFSVLTDRTTYESLTLFQTNLMSECVLVDIMH
jgi:hypothetical protein